MTKTQRSWGHEIKTLADHRNSVREAVIAVLGSFGAQAPTPQEHSCSSRRRCPGVRVLTYTDHTGLHAGESHEFEAGGPALYIASYRYITGRQGNVSRRDLFLCQPCAEKFATAHDLTLPALEAQP